MFIEEFKNIKSGKKELREFGLIMTIALSLLNLFLFWRKGEVPIPITFFAALFFFLGLFGQPFLRPLHKIWMAFSLIIGRITTTFILAILFYLVLVPIGLIMKLFNKDLLDLKFYPGKKSYWLEKDQSSFQKTSHERQF